MTDNQAVKIIQQRIDDLLKEIPIQIALDSWKRNGKSDNEIRDYLQQMAIATLYGAA